MNFTYENQGTSTFLVYEMEPGSVPDSVSMGMLTNNHIPGLAPVLFTQVDEHRYIKYNVSSKISLKQLLSSPISRKKLLGVLNGIADAMLSVEAYMLDPSDLVLETEYIFTDVSTGCAEMICLPFAYSTAPRSLCQYLKTVIFSVQFDASENNDYVAKLITCLNNEGTFSLGEFKKQLAEIETAQTPVPVSFAAASPRMAPAYGNVPPVLPAAPASSVVSSPVSVRMPAEPAPVARPVAGASKPAVRKDVPETKGVQPAAQTDRMTLMYLLNHYSKENKAIYDAQKAAAKNDPKPVKEKKEKKEKNGGKKPSGSAAGNGTKKPSGASAKKDRKKKAQQPSFAIPGQPVPVSGVQQNSAPVSLPQEVVHPAPAPVEKRPVVQTVSVPSGAAAAYPFAVPAASPAPLSFGETTVLSGNVCGETTVLNAAADPVSVRRPVLIRRKTGEKISVSGPLFRIGRDMTAVDYCVSGNPSVGRRHADIVTKNGAYFIVDINSTNHTYIDGKMIQSSAEYSLQEGMLIRLANEEFEFHLL